MSGAKLDFSNEYARNARLKPALLVSLPVALLAMTFGLKSSVLVGALFGPLTAVGFTYLLAHLTRDFGVKKQVELFRSWGGKPSVTKLRHRDTSLNPHTRQRYHDKAAELLGKRLPTPADEEANPSAADLLYEAYSNLLLERTRDTKKFRLLFEELIGYGFRRNLFALKTLGLWLCVFCLLAEIAVLVHAIRKGVDGVETTAVFAALDFFLMVSWWFWIRADWVRRAADAYADRLLAASENLGTVSAMNLSPETSRPKRKSTSAAAKPKVQHPEENPT